MNSRNWGMWICSFIALSLLTSGVILTISGARSDNPVVRHHQHIGIGLAGGGAIIILGMMVYFMRFYKKNQNDLGYEIV